MGAEHKHDYSGLTQGEVHATFNKLGGREGAKAFRRGDLVLVKPEQSFGEIICTVTIPAGTSEYDIWKRMYYSNLHNDNGLDKEVSRVAATKDITFEVVMVDGESLGFPESIGPFAYDEGGQEQFQMNEILAEKGFVPWSFGYMVAFRESFKQTLESETLLLPVVSNRSYFYHMRCGKGTVRLEHVTKSRDDAQLLAHYPTDIHLFKSSKIALIRPSV